MEWKGVFSNIYLFIAIEFSRNIFEKIIELEWVTLLNTMTNVVSLF